MHGSTGEARDGGAMSSGGGQFMIREFSKKKKKTLSKNHLSLEMIVQWSHSSCPLAGRRPMMVRPVN